MSDRYIVEQKDFLFADTPGDELPLDCGRSLKNVNIRYETYGELSPERDNAVLIMHALSGDAHVCGYHNDEEPKPGWWDAMVGPGKFVDTNRYFVVCSNIIGGCSGSTGPRSINPDTGKMYNLEFPVLTIADMTRAQKRLIDHLGIEKLFCVIGGSMGGMQALQFAVDYPEMVHSLAAIATATLFTPLNIALDWISRSAIIYDSDFNNGEYASSQPPEHGLSIARMLAHVTYLSDESMDRKFGRLLQNSSKYTYQFDRDFAVESYLKHQGQRFVERFDANSYLYITKAIDYFDLASGFDGSLDKAFANSKASFLVVSFSSDWLFPTSQSEKLVRALLNNNLETSFCEISSCYGHDAFLLEVDALGCILEAFLHNQRERWKNE